MSLIISRTGRWLYGGSVEMPFDIVGLDYDWWFESDNSAGMLAHDEKPMALGVEGLVTLLRSI
jgi:hypothetical protein